SRIHLAVLKLSNGSLEELRRWVAIAKTDYRDAIVAAESPGEMQSTFEPQPSSQEKKLLRKIQIQDQKQYLEWLRR
ncbi:MAG TPA: hypothetical protein VE685_04000, partial [Thermoanaerobaculia bacterium]|nr:hypothetical protein [Thermoanaerobaculia bacterium]